MSGMTWDLRIARASELSKKHSAVSALLDFYQSLAGLQKAVYESISASDEHEVSALLRHLPALIALIQQSGSPALKEAAVAVAASSEEERLALLAGFWQHEIESSELSAEYAFFA